MKTMLASTMLLLAACGITAAGTIHGTVRLEAAAPAMASWPGEKCCEGAKQIVEETVVVSAGGGLKNVLVYVEGAPAAGVPTSLPALLDQVGCRYVPHVIAIQTNQPLTVRTSDPTLHNVHYNPQINPAANFGLVRAGQEKTISFKSPEIFKLTCDVHPWMAAWVGVFENPYFSITTESGSFEIKDVPAGTWQLTCWHERFGKLQQQVTVTDDQTTEISLAYRAP